MYNYNPICLVNGKCMAYICFSWMAGSPPRKELLYYPGTTLGPEILKKFIEDIYSAVPAVKETVSLLGPIAAEELTAKGFDLCEYHKRSYYGLSIDPTKMNAKAFMVFATMIRAVQERENQITDYFTLREMGLNPVEAIFGSMIMWSSKLKYHERNSNHDLLEYDKYFTIRPDAQEILNKTIMELNTGKPMSENGRYFGVFLICETLVNFTNQRNYGEMKPLTKENVDIFMGKSE